LGKIKWNLLWAQKLINQGQPRQAYEAYSKLLALPLFEEEQSDIRLKQVYTLLMLGDTNKAKSIFERTENKIEQTKYYKNLYLKSIFYERCGEFEKARQSLLSAIGEHDSIQTIELAIIYNDLGRMEKILNNMTNVIHYYRKAAEIACHNNCKFLIHIVYPNIIDIYLLIGDNKKAISFFTKYSELIDKNNIDDLLKFNNYSLEYARQTEDRSLYIKTMEEGRIEVLPKLSERERLSFEVSELRIRWNSQYRWEEQVVLVSGYLSEYLKLEFPYRFNLIKEIYTVLCMFAENHKLGSFKGLFLQLLKFMWESKIDIDRYLIDLPDYCIYERCAWEEEMASLHRVHKKDECSGEVLKHLHNIKDIQLQHGNFLEAIKADLNIADECMGLVRVTRDITTINDLNNTMRQHLDCACRDLEKFLWHPASNEYVLRIARYALFLNDRERSRKYFDDFIQSKISIHHYAIWLQRYYHDLSQAFR
jgi:tetratricopeptide (TPR) repeat protein